MATFSLGKVGEAWCTVKYTAVYREEGVRFHCTVSKNIISCTIDDNQLIRYISEERFHLIVMGSVQMPGFPDKEKVVAWRYLEK
jgi:hypothetical protein